MDYRDESRAIGDVRWNDRLTYDGTWENNLFNFFTKVAPKLTEILAKPFVLQGFQRQDDRPVHKAVREALVNMIIHADYLSEGTLKVIRKDNEFVFTNPGILKLPKGEIYKGGNSKPRNSRMQTMLRMVGYGDNAGSGFPAILAAWAAEGWPEPELSENTVLNQVTLKMVFGTDRKEAQNGTREAVPDAGDTMNGMENRRVDAVTDSVRRMIDIFDGLHTEAEKAKLRPVIEYLKLHDQIDVQAAKCLTGKSRTTVFRYLNRLVELGILERDGESVSTVYRLK